MSEEVFNKNRTLWKELMNGEISILTVFYLMKKQILFLLAIKKFVLKRFSAISVVKNKSILYAL